MVAEEWKTTEVWDGLLDPTQASHFFLVPPLLLRRLLLLLILLTERLGQGSFELSKPSWVTLWRALPRYAATKPSYVFVPSDENFT